MATAKVSISNATDDTPAISGVFDGLSFFLIQRLPSRTTFIQRIQANGGRIVKLESQAEYIIADHVRKEAPTGSLSYTFIDAAIQNGELPNPDQHRAGPVEGIVREVGSVIPPRGTRNAFTPEEDLILWQWVQQQVKGGARVKGNEIYIQLEKINPRHTYQSWRDRYIKTLLRRPPPGVEVTVSANAPPSPPTAQDEREELIENQEGRPDAQNEVIESSSAGTQRAVSPEFTEEDQKQLLLVAKDIVEMHPSQRADAWQRWAEASPPHSAEEWQGFWRNVVRPIYERAKADEVSVQSVPFSNAAGQHASSGPLPSPSARKRSRENEQSALSQKRSRREPEPNPTERSEHSALEQAAAALEELPPQTDVISTQVIEILSSGESQETLTAVAAQEVNTAAGFDESAEIPLTKENVASQQAQHREDLLRGTDLPEDDDDQDGDQQDEFRRMLENVTDSANLVQNLPSQTVDMELAEGAYAQLLNFSQAADSNVLGAAALEDQLMDGPMSSQQEIDEAFEANINWPASPKPSRKKAQSHAIQFETQIAYPTLPGEHPSELEHERRSEPPSRFTKENEKLYRLLAQEPQHATAPPATAIRESHARDADVLEDVSIETRGDGQDAVDDQWEFVSEHSSFVEDIDLSIPEPEGWNSSSPAKFSLSQVDGAQSSKSPRTEVPDADADNVRSEKALIARESEDEELYEISSDTSSSSPSSHKETASITDARASRSRGSNVIETQDILNAETQQPDFAMPLPSDSEDEAEPEHSTPVHGPPRGWTHSEDELLLNGVANGLSSAGISKTLGSRRSPNAVRNRHALLSKQRPAIRSSRHGSQESLSSASSSQDALPSDPLDLPAFLATSASSRPVPLSNLQESQNFSDDGDAYEAYLIKKTQIEKYAIADVNEALRRTSMRGELADYVLLEQKRGKGLPTDIPGIWTVEEDSICEGSNAKAMRAVEQKHGWDEVEARMEFLQVLRD